MSEELNVQPIEQVSPEQDLVSKVSGYKSEETTPEVTPVVVDDSKFNTNDLQAEIDKITDPNLKFQMEGLKKSLQRGYNDKFQTIAETRKELERQMTESNNWTPERIQTLLNDQNFVAAAQNVMQAQNPPNSGKSDDEWSTLTDGEKARITSLQNEINLLKQQNMDASTKQLDEQLKSRYANYDAAKVAQLKDDLIHNRITATNEHLHKVLDYEAAIQRAYKMGKNEANGINKEKLDNSSYQPSSSSVVREPQLTDKAAPTLADIYKFNKNKTTQTIR